MKRSFLLISLIIITFQLFSQNSVSDSVAFRVETIMSQLTLDEKLSLMEHQNPAIPRVGLPAYSWWNEALHGVGRNGLATVWPMPIALAATFNADLVRDVFSATAVEAREKFQQAQTDGNFGDYAGLTFFTPNINIFRDPRWGRGMETYGEDPFLTATMGLACVNGLQTNDGNGHLATAACLKHLAVHSGPESTRHQFDVQISHRDLWTTYLPAFEYIIKNSDVQQVMCAYNRLNGVPCCTNRELLVDILRNQWRYNGLLVTDCWALNDCWERDPKTPRHETHPSAARAAADAFGSEVDLECGSGLSALKTAVDSGWISEEKIDEHVRRILTTRLRVTERFHQENDSHISTQALDNQTHISANSIVMLKNDHLLPLVADQTSVFLTGPNAADTLMPLGNYNGTPLHTISILEGMSDVFQLTKNVKKADVIVYAGGLSPQLEGEELPVDVPGFYKGDRTIIELPQTQLDELRKLKKFGKPIVLLLCTGSAIALENIENEVDAIFICWYGGEKMGAAVAQTLAGKYNSFGRLPVTFYRSSKQLPDFNDYNMQGRTYRFMEEKPLFPFGFGLSYSNFSLKNVTFNYENLTVHGTVSHDWISENCPISMGKAVVQVYVKNSGDTNAPKKSLVGYVSIDIPVNGKKDFDIQIDPYWLRVFDETSQQMVAPTAGTRFIVEIGFDSENTRVVAEVPTEALPETAPIILNRIDQWQDLKFGFMAHWGMYAQWGVVESWSICNEPWIDRKGADYVDYKQRYQSLNQNFNPKKFNPEEWAALAKEAGMKYFVFTTKHHDGFCMFDSKYTDYSVAGADCPYHTSPQPDITRAIVDAFHNEGLWTGLYFSKPDWHCDDYWAHEWATPDRNVNYDINVHPERWNKYKDFTYNQLQEITHNYGDIDILWLDGGWIRPEWSLTDETREWLGCYQRIQDIDMQRIAEMARSSNPDLILVDRSVGGKYENYRTPEQKVPDTLLPYPWETCMSMGDSWSYVENDNYKSTRQLIHTLIDIVAKGGNYLLNIGPDADGQIPLTAQQRLREMGGWLQENGYAIYGTRPLYPYAEGNVRYTQSKDGKHKYAITLLENGAFATVREF